MKKTFCGLFLLCLCLFALHAAATDNVVYLDGTGETEGAYTDFKTAVSALPSGGTLIVSGDTTIGTASSGATLNAVGGKVTVTGQNGAVLTMARSLTLASDFEFNNITFASTHESIGNLFCAGNDLTIGENVVTLPSAAGRYPCIYGGKSAGACTANPHIVIQSGTWYGIFGGNYGSTFTGDTTVDFTGGT
ncbi:MAG: hypothetical protein IJU41_07995, partial [Clostridia bacterium]|nr:hypothetical protein [Clostridia bacterium]